MDPVLQAALQQQQDDADEFDAQLSQQQASLDAQQQAMWARVLGGRRKNNDIPEELKPLIQKLIRHPNTKDLVPLVELLLANPLMIGWATSAVSAKLSEVQKAIETVLN